MTGTLEGSILLVLHDWAYIYYLLFLFFIPVTKHKQYVLQYPFIYNKQQIF